MKIKRYTHLGREVVDVTGPIHSADENVLLKIFSDFRSKDKSEQIIFRRLFVLDEAIIRQLTKLQSKDYFLQIVTDEIYLSAYLNKLGLNVLYEPVNGLFCQLKLLSQTKMIVLTGSADSSNKIHTLLMALPFLEDVSICIVQHISADARLIQNSILQPLTRYQVQYAQHGMKVVGGQVYICQPDHHLRIKQGIFQLDKDDAVQYARPSIDVTLQSLADEYGSQALAVVFCGYSSDGVAGTGFAVDKNMPVIIEEESECGAKELLKNIRESGHYHIEASLLKIVQLLAVMISDDKQLLKNYLLSAYDLYGYDFRNYVLESIERRIDAAVIKHHCLSRRHFLVSTLTYKQKFKRLLMELSISTSYFFRETNSWQMIKDQIFPELNRYHHIKVWSAGTSTGKEAYSLAMLAEQEGLAKKCLIYATDMNNNSLKIARNGLYPIDEMEITQENFYNSGGHGDIQRYIHKEKNFFSIEPRLREQVFFFRHNLVTEETMNEFHLILFNNVQIYFNQYLRDSVMDLITNSLIVGGYLVIGENENISGLQQEKHFKAITKNIYQRIC
ncbi:MAG: hypothetical protein KZQ83_16130 [gamma proteobacterium symbiont of Taylorina sp.]|nr:hypothetical protein [gamma proteobacterium symbiont of Taylorina sp.]